MRPGLALFFRAALLLLIWLVWWWAIQAQLPPGLNLAIIMGGVWFAYPLVWLGRVMLDRNPIPGRAAWVTTFVHYGLGLPFGVPIIRAIVTHQEWSGWVIPVPPEIGIWLVIVTGAAASFSVANLALKGLGAPFAIALSKRLAMDWWYAWTRNPMVLAALAFLLALGIWYQSALFVVWVVFVFAPALLFFVKVYEERELEVRFGASYLEYKSRTPMLFPRKPRTRHPHGG